MSNKNINKREANANKNINFQEGAMSVRLCQTCHGYERQWEALFILQIHVQTCPILISSLIF